MTEGFGLYLAGVGDLNQPALSIYIALLRSVANLKQLMTNNACHRSLPAACKSDEESRWGLRVDSLL